MPQYQQVPLTDTLNDDDLLLFWKTNFGANRNITFDDFFNVITGKVSTLNYDDALILYNQAIAATSGAEEFANQSAESANEAAESAAAASAIVGINSPQPAGYIIAGPANGPDDVPSARAMVESDVPASLRYRTGRVAQLNLGYIIAKMKRGATTTIACYSDSTTDGVGTTGFTQNPVDGSGNAVGNSDHNLTAPNAWPIKTQDLLRSYYANSNIHVWNAGYRGKRVDDGWALANYDTAVVNNPYYGDGTPPDAVILQWGLNDAKASSDISVAYTAQYRLLIQHILAQGTLPILMVPDAVWDRRETGTDGRENVEVSRELAPCLFALADEFKLPIWQIDVAQKNWLHNNSEGWDWGNTQPDAVHFNDVGHTFKAEFVARQLFRDVVDFGVKKERLTWSDSRVKYPFLQSYSATNNVVRFAPFPRLSASQLTENLGALFMEFWVWCDGAVASPSLVYRMSINSQQYGLSDPADAARIEVNGVDYVDPTAGPSPAITGMDRGWYIGKLKYGLNRVRMYAPNVSTSNGFNAGWWEILPRDPMWRNTSAYLGNPSPSFGKVNLIKDTGPISFKKDYVSGTEDVGSLVFPESESLDNVVSLSKVGDSVSVYWRGIMEPRAGLLVFAGKGNQSLTNYVNGIAFSRRAVTVPDAINVINLGRVDTNGYAVVANGTVAKTWEDDGTDKLLIVVTRTAMNAVTVKVYDGWSVDDTELVSVTSTSSTSTAATNLGGPCGVMGGAFALTSESAPSTSIETLELYAEFTPAS